MTTAACPICESELVEEEGHLHGRMKQEPSLYSYNAFCPKCRINLSRHVSGPEDTGWITPKIEIGSISAILDDSDLLMISGTLKNYPATFQRWQAGFLDIKQAGDRVGVNPMPIGGFSGLALIRNKIIVAVYMIPSTKLPHKARPDNLQ